MILSILAAASVAITQAPGHPIFLNCVAWPPSGKVTHTVVIDVPMAWVDGDKFRASLTSGGTFYTLRGPIVAPNAQPRQQIVFNISRLQGGYSVLDSHSNVLEIAPGIIDGCTIAKPIF